MRGRLSREDEMVSAAAGGACGACLVGVACEVAVLAAQHDGHLSDVHLPLLLPLRVDNSPVRAEGVDCLDHVDVKRGRVGEIAQSGLLGEEGARLAVDLGHHSLGEVNLPE